MENVLKVKNVQDVFTFPAGNLVGDDVNTIVRNQDESDEDYAKRSVDLRAAMAKYSSINQYNETHEDKKSQESNLEDLQNQLHPGRVQQYKNLGVQLPSDLVKVTMTLGTLIFDLYSSVAKSPSSAPLATVLFNKKIQNLATRLQKEEFSLEPDLLGQVRLVLEDENLWNRINLTIFTTVEGQRVYTQVNHNAAGFFPNVMQAAISLFLPEVDEVVEPTETVNEPTI